MSRNTYERTEDGKIVGPKMKRAVEKVDRDGSIQSKHQLALSVGPNESTDYGYRIVNRCTRKNLLEVDPEHDNANPHGQGAVVITERGKRFLEDHE